MGNSIKYTTGTESNSLSKGNFRIGAGDVGKGPTSSTGFYKATTPPSGGYRIYLYNTNVSGNVAYYTAANNAELISFTNNIAGQSFTSTTQCLTYYSTQTDKICFNREYEGVSTNGLVFNIDAGFAPSYPTSGITWYNISLSGNNGTLTNSPTFNSDNGGSIVFDGVDDFVSGTEIAELGYTNNYTVIIWLNNNNGGYVMSNKSDVGERFGININSVGTVSGFFYNGSVYTTVGRVTRFGAWEQVVVVNQSQQLTMYVSMNKTTTGGSALDPGNNGLRIGRRNRTSELYFNGKISQVQVYNRAMTESEILYNYQKMLPRFVGENFVTNGLVFYVDAGYTTSYPTSGTTWYDVSGYNNNGTLTNGPTYSGGSIVFDGTNDYVNFSGTQNGVLNITANTITLSTFIRYQTTGNFQSLFYKDLNNTKGYQLFITSTNKVGFGVTTNTGFIRLVTTNNLIQNTWVCVTAVYDGTNLRIYINGTLTDFTPKTGNILDSSDRPLLISLSTFGSEVFRGNIGISQIYNRALSASEVLQNYDAQKGRFGL